MGRLLWRSGRSMLASAGTRDAAQLAYYLVMSLPTIVLLLVWGCSTVLDDDSVREPIVDAIVQTIPLADPSDRDQVERLLDDVAAGAGGLGWLSAAALLYSASGAIGATRHAVNEAWGTPDTRPFVLGKALDVGLTLGVAPVVLIALGLTLSGELASAIGDHPWLAAAAQFGVTRSLPLALAFAVLAALFLVLAESPAASLRTAWPGALVSVLGFIVIELAAGVYYSLVGDSNAIYGTMGMLLALIFSAYLLGLVMVLGAHVSAQAGRSVEKVDTVATAWLSTRS